jgi:hypothetical protein
MNEAQQAHADLAFMKTLVEETGRSQMMGGAGFLAAGLLYGLQCLVQWAELAGIVHLSSTFMLVFVIGITVVFLTVLGVVLWAGRKTAQGAVGTRALNGAFGGAGLANLVLCSAIGLVAARERSVTIWLLYPVTICVVMGMAWYVAFMIRRRLWVALVSVAWYLTAVGLALLVRRASEYVLLLGLAFLVLMALPGGIMIHTAKRSS